MRFVYVTDLHGWEEGFEATLRFAEEAKSTVIINGGDMLPKATGILKAQRRFIQSWLPGYLDRCTAAGIRFYGMFGNDDLASMWPYWHAVISEHGPALDLADRWHELPGNYRIRGINYVPDAPFGLKDWMVLDSPGWTRPLQTCRAILSGPKGFEEISDVESFFAERPTLADILAEVSGDFEKMRKSILVMHAPPNGLGLATLGGILRGRDVGSSALRAWIETNQPLLTLHGHIHESPDVTNIYTAKIGQTICHQPGQNACSYVTLSVIDVNGEKVNIDRRIVPV
jgi:uncharacterized protein